MKSLKLINIRLGYKTQWMGTTTEQKGQERICELEDRTIEIAHSEQKRVFINQKKNEQSLKDLWDINRS